MNIEYIRKLASIEQGKRYLEGRFGTQEIDAVAHAHLVKAAAAEDRDLLMIASRLPGPTLETYEALGGTFKKEAIGAPMFNVGGGGTPPIMPALKPPAPPQQMPMATPGVGGPATAGGGIPQIKQPKIPGQQVQGMGQGVPKTSSANPGMKKEKKSGISSTDISMMQQAFLPPGQQPQQAVPQTTMPNISKVSAVKEALSLGRIMKVTEGGRVTRGNIPKVNRMVRTARGLQSQGMRPSHVAALPTGQFLGKGALRF